MPRPVPNTQTGFLTDNQHSTNDLPILDPGTGPFEPQRVLFGDAFAVFDDSRGGNDTLIGGDNAKRYSRVGRRGGVRPHAAAYLDQPAPVGDAERPGFGIAVGQADDAVVLCQLFGMPRLATAAAVRSW
jgi:hypothetical protein